jgi:hypothetical protein
VPSLTALGCPDGGRCVAECRSGSLSQEQVEGRQKLGTAAPSGGFTLLRASTRPCSRHVDVLYCELVPGRAALRHAPHPDWNRASPSHPVPMLAAERRHSGRPALERSRSAGKRLVQPVELPAVQMKCASTIQPAHARWIAVYGHFELSVCQRDVTDHEFRNRAAAGPAHLCAALRPRTAKGSSRRQSARIQGLRRFAAIRDWAAATGAGPYASLSGGSTG